MVRTDPYARSGRLRYECRSCLEVVFSEERVSKCPACGTPMQNVSVPRE